MSGTWLNCKGSNQPPAPGIVAIPKWAITGSAEFQDSVRRDYGTCSVCSKVVKLRSDGTVRVHVDTEEAKRTRKLDAEQIRSAAISDLLKMREELGD